MIRQHICTELKVLEYCVMCRRWGWVALLRGYLHNVFSHGSHNPSKVYTATKRILETWFNTLSNAHLPNTDIKDTTIVKNLFRILQTNYLGFSFTVKLWGERQSDSCQKKAFEWRLLLALMLPYMCLLWRLYSYKS